MKKSVNTARKGSGTWTKTVGIGDDELRTIIQTRDNTISKAKVNGIGMDLMPYEIEFEKHDREEKCNIFFEVLQGNIENIDKL
jgi:hypothetical protein